VYWLISQFNDPTAYAQKGFELVPVNARTSYVSFGVTKCSSGSRFFD
jgi:hypothetical protein